MDIVIKEVLGDGSCFFHAVLLGIDENYQQVSTNQQIIICHTLRNNIAQLLQQLDVNHPGYYYWETINHLEYLYALLSQDNSINYEPAALSAYFANIHAPAGDEAYVFIPHFYNCNLVIVAQYNNTFHKYYQSPFLIDKDIVIVLYTPGHYRLLCSSYSNKWSLSNDRDRAFLDTLNLDQENVVTNTTMLQQYITLISSYIVDNTLDLSNFILLQNLPPYHFIIRHILQACQHLINVKIIGILTGNRTLEHNIIAHLISPNDIESLYQQVDMEPNYYYRNLLCKIKEYNIEAYNILQPYYN